MILTKLKRVATFALVLAASTKAVLAHISTDHNGQNGGQVVATQHNHVELVRSDDEISIYLYDLSLEPRNSTDVTIEATLVEGTTQTELELTFTPPNKFSAKTDAAASSATIVLRLFRDGAFWDLTRLK